MADDHTGVRCILGLYDHDRDEAAVGWNGGCGKRYVCGECYGAGDFEQTTDEDGETWCGGEGQIWSRIIVNTVAVAAHACESLKFESFLSRCSRPMYIM